MSCAKAMKLSTWIFSGALAAGLTTAPVSAQIEKVDGYPDRTISVIVGFGAGGGSDQVARAWATPMQRITNVGFQVENRPGGGGLVATRDYMSRRADGYTILQQTDTLVTAVAAGQLPWEIGPDIVPICITQSTFSQLYINPEDDRFTDWETLLDYAKKNPGQLTVAMIGIEGAKEPVLLHMLEQGLGIKFRAVSFDQPGERYGSLIGRQTDLLVEQPGGIREFVEAGQMKPVLTLVPERPKLFEDIPSLADIGLGNGIDLRRIRGFFVNGNVPEDRIAYLEQTCEQAYNDPEYQKFNERTYMHLARSYYDRKDATELLNAMVESYRTVYRQIGLIE